MTTLIKTVKFNNNTIRVLGTYDRPLFVAADVCKVLGIANVTDTLRSLPDKWKEICDIENSDVTSTARKTQKMYCITEAAVYRVIMRSNKQIAQPFQEAV